MIFQTFDHLVLGMGDERIKENEKVYPHYIVNV